MKKILVLIAVIALSRSAVSQIGLGVTTPHPNAYFQINSTNKGVLLPRMTAVQRLAIAPAATANGLIVFDTDSSAYMYWTGIAWKKMGSDDGNWIKNGNDIYNSNSGNVGIGTSMPVAKLHLTNGSVLLSSNQFDQFTSIAPPNDGNAARLLWYPQKAAFRVGRLDPGCASCWDRDSIGLHSFAAGYNVKANGSAAVALGFNANASGVNSFATGWSQASGPASFASGNSTSSGYSSVAMGLSTATGSTAVALGGSFAVGDYSFSAGYNARATGYGAVAIGFSDSALGIYSTALGRNSAARGNYSFASGDYSVAAGSYSIAMGLSVAGGNYSFAAGNSYTTGIGSAAVGAGRAFGNGSFAGGFGYAEGIGAAAGGRGAAIADYATAFGNESFSYGYASFTGGDNTFARARGAVSLGMFNNTLDNPDPLVTAPTDRIFQLGNGSDELNRTNAITVLRNGNVGIGILTPAARLELNGSIKIIDGTQAAGKVLTSDGTGLASWQTLPASSAYWTANGTHIYNNNTGNVGIGVNNPISPLSFGAVPGNKISLWGTDPNNHYGFGIQGFLMQMYCGDISDNIAFGYGSSSNFTERMRITGTGNVGIGNADPAYRLDVTNRIRIRSGGNISNSAGIWLNSTDNTSLQAFVGIESDNAVGFYGSSSGWSFTMNTNTGKIKIADGTQAAGRILSSDASGVASWVNSTAVTSAVTGVFAGGGTNLTTAMGPAYLNTYIDLPPGKWIVLGTYLMSQGGSGGLLLTGQSMWVRTSFSSSNIANISTGDIIGSGLMSGSISYPSPFAVINGQNIINNTSGGTKRYYVWGLMSNTGGQPAGFSLDGLGSNFWSENQLTAVPMN